MNNMHNNDRTKQHPNRRLTSYVTGFMLSLVFTLIPYDLVVRRSLKGNVLIGTILVFAMVQLFIQLFFFLHLGRDRKTRWNVIFLINTFAIVLVVVGASIWIMSHLKHNMTAMEVTDKISSDEQVYQVNGSQTGTCPGDTGKNHTVIVKNDSVSPNHTDAKLCDTLIIINEDKTARVITFGQQGNNDEYAGQGEQSIRPGTNMQVNLTKAGNYTFHDESQAQLTGTFTVTH